MATSLFYAQSDLLVIGRHQCLPAQAGKLAGCLNDVSHFRDYLTGSFVNRAVEVLKDGEATAKTSSSCFAATSARPERAMSRRSSIAAMGRAGHRPRELLEFYRDGKDEGLVCVDSRLPGGFDLADKELAVLISEVATNNPHIAIVLDCCHSGSATRGVDAFSDLIPRVTHEVTAERPLESYLDGYYSTLPLTRNTRSDVSLRTRKTADLGTLSNAWPSLARTYPVNTLSDRRAPPAGVVPPSPPA